MDKHIHVYTHMLFLCVYVTIFWCLSMCTYECTFWCMYHTHINMCIIKNVSIYAHLKIFIWTNTYLTNTTKCIKGFLSIVQKKMSPVLKVWKRFTYMEWRNITKCTVLKLAQNFYPSFNCHKKTIPVLKVWSRFFRWSQQMEQFIQF